MAAPFLISITSPIQQRWQRIPNPLKGVGFALFSTALFVMVGVFARLLGDTIGASQILLSRQVVFILLLLPSMATNWHTLVRPQYVPWHVARVIGAFLALYCGFVVVANLPLADFTALSFTSVLFVAVLASSILGESVAPKRWLTLLLGFVGVMLVVQPGFGHAQGNLDYIGLGLLGAAGAAVAVISVKHLSQTQSKIALMSYQAVFVGVIALPIAVLEWQWPTSTEWLLLLLVGVLSSLAQWVGISAYRWTDANVIANVEYVKILYSIGLGYMLFHEIPNDLAWFGVLVLISSALIPLMTNRPHQR